MTRAPNDLHGKLVQFRNQDMHYTAQKASSEAAIL